MICGIPGFLLGLGVLALREPVRGASDHLADSAERGSIRGLLTEQSLLDDHPGRRHDDVRDWRPAGVDADVPGANAAPATRSRQH